MGLDRMSSHFLQDIESIWSLSNSLLIDIIDEYEQSTNKIHIVIEAVAIRPLIADSNTNEYICV